MEPTRRQPHEGRPTEQVPREQDTVSTKNGNSQQLRISGVDAVRAATTSQRHPAADGKTLKNAREKLFQEENAVYALHDNDLLWMFRVGRSATQAVPQSVVLGVLAVAHIHMDIRGDEIEGVN